MVFFKVVEIASASMSLEGLCILILRFWFEGEKFGKNCDLFWLAHLFGELLKVQLFKRLVTSCLCKVLIEDP